MSRIAWILEDPTEGTVEFMSINPNAGASPAYQKNLTKKTTTAGRTLVQEGQDNTKQFDFSGVILTEDQYNFLYNAWNKRHPVKLTDDLNRTFTIYMESFQPTRQLSRTYPWKHEYQATSVILD
jgi:hypothetical protein